MRAIYIAPLVLASLLLVACSDGGDTTYNEVLASSPDVVAEALPEYNFEKADAALESFLDTSDIFEGVSITIVDLKQGVVHENAFGDHTLDTIVQLASTSKVPTVSLLMAIHEDESLEFDITRSIDNYLPWEGIYGDRNTTQLVSNTSGIPGLISLLTKPSPEASAHSCQFDPNIQHEECDQILYSVELPDTKPAGSGFDYGGTQWQLAGAVAQQVTNSSFNQAFSKYIAEPCDLEVFQYGNHVGAASSWDGHPDSLIGQMNASAESGGISNMRDYAKILLMHLSDGICGDTQVLSKESVEFMRIDRASHFGPAYGMGWWIVTPPEGMAASVYYDPGLFGTVAWIDIERKIGGYVAVDHYAFDTGPIAQAVILGDIIPLVAQAIDEARAAVTQ